METKPPEVLPGAVDEQPKRRRRHRKSRKMKHEQRRQWKSIGFWLIYGAVGVAIATAIAVMAGQSSGN